MPPFDPLALRHGDFVLEAWSSIGDARISAQTGVSGQAAAQKLAQMRQLKSELKVLRRSELRRQDFPISEINGWFEPLESSLSKAELFFAGRLAELKMEEVVH
ncbi:MAG: hypothetical protein AAF700_11270 [Pseudomonadota bacterium]